MPKPVEMPVEFLESITKYKNFECSANDLSKKYKVSCHTIRKWLAANGVIQHPKNQLMSLKAKNRVVTKTWNWSEESKLAQSHRLAGRKPTTLGFIFSEESRKKMSDSAKIRAKIEIENGTRCVTSKKRLSDEERICRNKSRDACKRLLHRVLTMSRKRKDATTEILLGYSKTELRYRIESTFTSEMGWDKPNSFQIDHIKPVAAFFREGIYNPAIINALDNLQALSPFENRRKSDRFDPNSHGTFAGFHK